ncbi:MAG: hypothetical protein ABIO19_04185 [Burkholderiaceae bacterium]
MLSTVFCKPARCSEVAAGSSTWPISPSEKMTLAAAGLSSNNFFRSDQMNINNPVTDRTKENSNMVIVSMGLINVCKLKNKNSIAMPNLALHEAKNKVENKS